MRKEITEAQITELMRAIPRAEEVDRLRAEIERLRAALSSVRIDGPDSEGLVWVSFVSQGLAARAHVVVGDENRMASRVALRFKELRRAALEGKP
jgi:hypothetical protein